MSATTEGAGRVRLTFPRVARAELTKLTSLRSTWFTLAGVAVFAVGISGAIGYGVRHAIDGGDPPPTPSDAIAAAFLPVDFYALVVGVLGVLQITGEYPLPVRATLTAVPRRGLVLLAKAAVQLVVTVPAMAVMALTSFLVSQAFLGDAGLSLGDPDVARTIAGAAGCPVLTGLLGLGIGTLLRHTAGSITTLVAMLFVIPLLLGPALPGDLEDDVLRFVPTVAGQAMYGVDGGGTPFETLPPAASALVLAGWAAAALAVGAQALLRRDA